MTEAVAPARRALPPGGVVPENYFDGEGGAPTKTSLLDLFEQGKDTLFICSMMFPRAPDEDLPCPSCTQLFDSFDGVAEHARPAHQRRGRREDGAAARPRACREARWQR